MDFFNVRHKGRQKYMIPSVGASVTKNLSKQKENS